MPEESNPEQNLPPDTDPAALYGVAALLRIFTTGQFPANTLDTETPSEDDPSTDDDPAA
ncbi:MAG TPA: hypothetical protein VLG92_04170 [Candidatus Saccharimonadia bacterium]|nr:hypothetical protein [Candidatus Saccharimonadia bacterium]